MGFGFAEEGVDEGIEIVFGRGGLVLFSVDFAGWGKRYLVLWLRGRAWLARLKASHWAALVWWYNRGCRAWFSGFL